MDAFSKYLWGAVLPCKSAAAVADGLLSFWLVDGAPAIMQSDSGCEFKNATVRRLCARFGVDYRYCRPYNSRCNGVIERCVRTLRGMADRFLAEREGREGRRGGRRGRRPDVDWDRLVSWLVASYNRSRHSVTKLPPLFVHKGVESPPVPPPLPAAGDVAPALASCSSTALEEEAACAEAGAATDGVEDDGSEEAQPTPYVSRRPRTRGSTRRARSAERGDYQLRPWTGAGAAAAGGDGTSSDGTSSSDTDGGDVTRRRFVQERDRKRVRLNKLVAGRIATQADRMVKRAGGGLPELAVGDAVRVAVGSLSPLVARRLKDCTQRATVRRRWSAGTFHVAAVRPKADGSSVYRLRPARGVLDVPTTLRRWFQRAELLRVSRE